MIGLLNKELMNKIINIPIKIEKILLYKYFVFSSIIYLMNKKILKSY